MRDLTYFVAVSLDGQIASSGGDFSAFPVEGDHMETILSDWADALPAAAHTALGVTPDRTRFDCVVMGWHTYEVGLPHGVSDPYPHLEQYVATRRHLDASVPTGVSLIENPITVVRRLKAEDGAGVWLCGGGELAAVLSDEIDRLVLKVNPIFLGQGLPLFAGDRRPSGFELERSTAHTSGVLINEYRRTI